MHVVPAATGWTTDHAPLAHCWNDVPPMQLNIPSEVQGPESPPELELPVLLEGESAPVAAAVATGEAAGVDVSPVALAAAGDTTVANTPPCSGLAVEEPWAAAAAVVVVTCGESGATSEVEVATGGTEAAAGEVATVAPAPPAVGDTDGATALAHAEPVGVDRADDVANPSCSTESPGSGKRTSVESTVVQPLPILARNMFGSASYAAVSRFTTRVSFCAAASSSLRLEEELLVSVTGAQFMYISRLPILLNQVQAKVADPVGRDVGTVKL